VFAVFSLNSNCQDYQLVHGKKEHANVVDHQRAQYSSKTAIYPPNSFLRPLNIEIINQINLYMEKKSAPTSFLSSNAGGKRKELKRYCFIKDSHLLKERERET